MPCGKRVIAACVEIMGRPAEQIERVIGPIEIVPCGWTIRSFRVIPQQNNMIAREVVDLMSRVWECAPDSRTSAYETSDFPPSWRSCLPDHGNPRLFWPDGNAPQAMPMKEEAAARRLVMGKRRAGAFQAPAHRP